uniref:Uncharacterized protein n=1 Tax=Neolamprologus brichardi TaxID=32507 RepID=A0A3Q4HGC9_NEOBR
MTKINESGRGDKDDLHHPEADVRNGEGRVIADVLTTRLLGVAREAGLLVAPHLLSSSPQHQDAEDEQHCQPDFAHYSGVLLISHTVLQLSPQLYWQNQEKGL